MEEETEHGIKQVTKKQHKRGHGRTGTRDGTEDEEQDGSGDITAGQDGKEYNQCLTQTNTELQHSLKASKTSKLSITPSLILISEVS